MGKKIIRDLLILLSAFGLIWVIFSLFSYPEDPSLFSIQNEENIGEVYLDMTLKSPMFPELQNAFIDSGISSISDRLVTGLGSSDYTYNFVVFESEMINAFTIPGGNILISSGLIRFCDSAEDLAVVIAHEMGHVEERHVISRLIKELGIEILTSGDPYVIGEVTSILTSTGFDRKQEEEADQFALELLEASSIQPQSLATFFRKLEAELDNELLEHFEIISTHPNFSSRIRHALSYVPSDDFESSPINLDWGLVKKELDPAKDHVTD